MASREGTLFPIGSKSIQTIKDGIGKTVDDNVIVVLDYREDVDFMQVTDKETIYVQSHFHFSLLTLSKDVHVN